jgi:hypothetical protein
VQFIQKSIRISILCTAGLLATTAALAATQTGWLVIDDLVIGTSMNGAYRVYPIGGATTNPASCANTEYYEVSGAATSAEKDLMNRTLLAAFLAGREIRLMVSGSGCAASGRPAYSEVLIDKDH